MSDRYVMSEYHGHDGALAIVGEGRICHLEVERYSRQRHDNRNIHTMREQIYRDALRILGICPEQIVAVVGVSGAMGASPETWYSMEDIIRHAPRPLIDGIQRPLYGIPHHTAHAAYAFWTSPHESMRLAAIDGGGDAYTLPFWTDRVVVTTATGHASQRLGESARSWHLNWAADQFVGGQWINASYAIFGRSHQEGSVMALSGLPVEAFQRLTGYDKDLTARLSELQRITNEAINRIVPPLGNGTSGPVGLAGGCALNGVAVYNLMQRPDVSTVYVPPSVDDGGIVVGACLHVLHHVLGEPRHRYSWQDVAYAGYTDDELDGQPPVAEIAAALADGKVVAIAHGRAESGPRALGHRSLLADPRQPTMKDKLNRIKGRQPWRPAAPVVLERFALDYFDVADPGAFRFMTTICLATERGAKELPGAVHYDGSARVQVVDPGSGVMSEVLEAFYALTGCPALLNTSFNTGGEAIVNNGEHARATFARSPEIDVLVVGETMVCR